MKYAADEQVDHLPLLTDPVPSAPPGTEDGRSGQAEFEGYDPYNHAPPGRQRRNG
jgi:hypothetical protein